MNHSIAGLLYQTHRYDLAEAEYRKNLDHASEFYVRNARGEMVPLSALAKFEPRPGPDCALTTRTKLLLQNAPCTSNEVITAIGTR